MNNINLDPSKDSADWERMLLLAGVNRMIRLQRQENRLELEQLEALTK